MDGSGHPNQIVVASGGVEAKAGFDDGQSDILSFQLGVDRRLRSSRAQASPARARSAAASRPPPPPPDGAGCTERTADLFAEPTALVQVSV